MEAPIVITAASALTHFGMGTEAYRLGVQSGTTSPQPIDGAYVDGVVCAQVPAYDAKKMLAVRSISAFDRLTLHVGVTVDDLLKQLGLADPNGRAERLADDRIGLVVGSSGPIQSIVNFDLQAIEEPRYVQPSMVPNVVFNVPASYAAIRHRIRGSCITLTDGDTSALKALAVAVNQLENGRTDISIAGGAEEATPAYGMLQAALARSEQRNCRALTEGAAFFSLEKSGAGRVTTQPALAGVFGCAQAFSPKDVQAGLRHCLKKLRDQFGPLMDQVATTYHSAEVDPGALGLTCGRNYATDARLGHAGAMSASLSMLDMLTNDQIPVGDLVLLLEADQQGACAAALLQKQACLATPLAS